TGPRPGTEGRRRRSGVQQGRDMEGASRRRGDAAVLFSPRSLGGRGGTVSAHVFPGQLAVCRHTWSWCVCLCVCLCVCVSVCVCVCARLWCGVTSEPFLSVLQSHLRWA